MEKKKKINEIRLIKKSDLPHISRVAVANEGL